MPATSPAPLLSAAFSFPACLFTSLAAPQSFQCPRNSGHQRLRSFSRFFAFHSHSGFSALHFRQIPAKPDISWLCGNFFFATSPSNFSGKKHETGKTWLLTSVAAPRSFQCPRNSERQRFSDFSRFFALHSRFGFFLASFPAKTRKARYFPGWWEVFLPHCSTSLLLRHVCGTQTLFFPSRHRRHETPLLRLFRLFCL